MNTPKNVLAICHSLEERKPYVQKTIEEATFEYNKNHPWNFKDLFKRKDYVYFQRDKIAKSCFVCGKYNHTASSCFYYLQQQRNLKQQAFEKTNKNKKVRSFETRTQLFHKSVSLPRKVATSTKLTKAQQSCIICGESDHFAADCKLNPFNQFTQPKTPSETVKTIPDRQKSVYVRTPKEKPIFNRKKKNEQSAATASSANAKLTPSAATKSSADQSKP
ncbi:hypothetical protein L1987_18464 [Smallanthus sonchifolius]|uniref:Uncharacterized protein n=1 Tax=Smallanthus sonchifolius TaxID=185202 RepID=A0ACB9J1B1_9ASTR|nr:hypothetical protein L1987_18464 [Smallanthus sonchifolius]